jgi:succinyl-CoA synthetase alpha subunit
MSILTRLKPSEYHDSVTLMLSAQAVLKLPGVQDAAVVMGTPANREIIAAAGLLTPAAEDARPDDLLIVVRAEDEASALAALARAEEILAARAPRAEGSAAQRPKSLASAIAATPGANLAVISVAGRYAAGEARTALENGLHVLLFSDNVPLDEEIALKSLAADRGLLCMGPDAGTAIINGVALGFANAVPRGSVGLVSAAGTGLQGVTCGLARAGAGVSQAIGTGGRDLSEAVGGATMLAGLAALQDDPDTGVIVLICKPPAAAVADRVLKAVTRAKPTVVCFLGAEPGPIEAAGAIPATTLTQAAATAAALATGRNWCDALVRLEEESKALIRVAAAEQAKLSPGQYALRGLFAGGTFCYEAQLILRNLPEPVHSNAPLVKTHKMADSLVSRGHVCVDLGEDEFTQGRLHPMIDPSLRNRRILQEARDQATAVILLDIVLGYGAHPDPAGATVEVIREAQAFAAASGRHIVFIASVCGTDGDPQPLSQQEAKLRDADVLVLPDNASAARLAGLITQALHG